MSDSSIPQLIFPLRLQFTALLFLGSILGGSENCSTSIPNFQPWQNSRKSLFLLLVKYPASAGGFNCKIINKSNQIILIEPEMKFHILRRKIVFFDFSSSNKQLHRPIYFFAQNKSSFGRQVQSRSVKLSLYLFKCHL